MLYNFLRNTQHSAFLSHLLFYVLLTTFYVLTPARAQAEYIDSFQSDIEVKKDGTFTVTETINYVFTEERHGIYREIPLIIEGDPNPPWRERYMDVELTGVSMDGEEEPYVLESTKERFKVRIGDADVTIKDSHTYTISYTVGGGLSYPVGQGTDLYFNVTGNEWQVPIRRAEATVRGEGGLLMANRSCYEGPVGKTGSSCLMEVLPDGDVRFTAKELAPYEGMTIAQALNVALVARDIRERTRMEFVIVPLSLFALLYGGYRMYRYKTAHKTGRTIIPEYEPYPGILPMYTGLLMDGTLDPKDITATIVFLAREGYLTIKKTEKKVLFLFEVDDYELTLTKLPGDEVGAFEKRLLGIVFKEPLTAPMTVSLSELKRDRSEQIKDHAAIQSLQSDLAKDLEKLGYFEHLPVSTIVTMGGAILVSVCVISLILFGGFGVGSIISGFVLALIVLLIVYRRRTEKGYTILDYLKGFKLFLNTTERDRYLFHNAPEKSPEQFMEYLPYAIAFGVEKEWAKVFEGITIPNPDWYDGGSVSSFSATNLTTSLGAFSTAFAASSGASASSGGGSSGGGSGGGGGGSW